MVGKSVDRLVGQVVGLVPDDVERIRCADEMVDMPDDAGIIKPCGDQ